MNVKVYNNASEEHLKHSMVLFLSLNSIELYTDKECSHHVTDDEVLSVLEAYLSGQLVVFMNGDDGTNPYLAGFKPSTVYIEADDDGTEEITFYMPMPEHPTVYIKTTRPMGLIQKFTDMIMSK